LALLVVGCGGGGGGGATTGAFQGYVYYSPATAGYDISGITPAPAGSTPVAGAVVAVPGVPGATITTTDTGFYQISDIPPGGQTLDVSVSGNVVLSAIVVSTAGMTTMGHGHWQGGG
jgi:hypothetical protein